jgi:hypothetical protein
MRALLLGLALGGARHTLKSKMLLGLTAGLVVIAIALTPDLKDRGMCQALRAPSRALGSLASAEVWDPLPQSLYFTVASRGALSYSKYQQAPISHASGWQVTV